MALSPGDGSQSSSCMTEGSLWGSLRVGKGDGSLVGKGDGSLSQLFFQVTLFQGASDIMLGKQAVLYINH